MITPDSSFILPVHRGQLLLRAAGETDRHSQSLSTPGRSIPVAGEREESCRLRDEEECVWKALSLDPTEKK